jgi:colanic acid/amylovoran biosynthesis glycosyltransferase
MITSTFPYGEGEDFFEAEVRGLIASGLNVIILPVWPRGSIRQGSSDLKQLTLNRYGISLYVFCATFFRLLYQELRSTNRRRFNLVTRCLRESIAAAYAPQLSKKMSDLEISHIHAYWSSGPAMLAMGTSRLTNINWSFTGHSGDLIEGVDLNKKAKSSSGIRVISKRSEWILKQKAEKTKSPEIIHLGVKVPSKVVAFENSSDFNVACVGNLIPIKNHVTLIEAIKIVQSGGLSFSVDFVGAGPLENDLKKSVKALGLENSITFRGQIDHAQLMMEYSQAKYHLVILASGIASSGQQEGIPVSLMEAMSYGIPVVSTDTGGIPELVTKELDLLIPSNDPWAMGSKILEIMNMTIDQRAHLGRRCRTRVVKDFNVVLTSERYAEWLTSHLQ